jgi:hypothetical protein
MSAAHSHGSDADDGFLVWLDRAVAYAQRVNRRKLSHHASRQCFQARSAIAKTNSVGNRSQVVLSAITTSLVPAQRQCRNGKQSSCSCSKTTYIQRCVRHCICRCLQHSFTFPVGYACCCGMQAGSNAVATNNQGGHKGSNASHVPWVGDNMGALVTEVPQQVVRG